jgi:hypothetical protein
MAAWCVFKMYNLFNNIQKAAPVPAYFLSSSMFAPHMLVSHDPQIVSSLHLDRLLPLDFLLFIILGSLRRVSQYQFITLFYLLPSPEHGRHGTLTFVALVKPILVDKCVGISLLVLVSITITSR